jgi:WD40 repeat protein
VQRHVALKVLRSQIGADNDFGRANEKQIEILRREASAISILQNPHIVTLYDLQLDQSPPFLVMEYVDGESLAELIEQHPQGIDAKQAATIVLGILEGMSVAHSRGILHRDIKPSNVLLDRSRSFRDLKFCPKLADFGLARNVEQDSLSLSQDGFVGTITFAPPELLHQIGASYTERSDIYSLGCILYCLLRGKKPFDGATFIEVVHQIKEGIQIPLAEGRSIPKDLIAICNQAMALEPVDRYATATTFAEDLERFLSNEPVLARRAPPLIRAFRWMRRNVWATVAASSLLFAIVIAAMLFLWNHSQLRQFNLALDSRNTELTAALEASHRANYRNEQIIYALDLNQAANDMEEGNYPAARAILDKYTHDSSVARHRDVDWFLLQRQIGRTGTVLGEFERPLYVGRWDSNSRRYYVGGANGSVFCINADSHINQTVLAVGDTDINAITWLTGPSDAWISCDDGRVQNCNLLRGELLAHASLPDPDVKAFDILLLPAVNKILVLGSNDRIYFGSVPFGSDSQADSSSLKITQLQRAAILDRSTGEEHAIRSISPGPDVQTFLIGSDFRSLLIVDASDFEIQQSISLSDQEDQFKGAEVVDQVVLHPNKRWAACTTQDHYLKVVDLQEGRLLSSVSLPAPQAAVQWMPHAAVQWMNVTDPVQSDGTPLSLDLREASSQLWMAGRQNSFARYSVSESGQITLEQVWAAENERIFGFLANSELEEFVTLSKSGRVHAWRASLSDPTVDSATFKVESPLHWFSFGFWSNLAKPNRHNANKESKSLLVQRQPNGQVKAYFEENSSEPMVLLENLSNENIGGAGPHGLFLAGTNRLRLLPQRTLGELASSKHPSAVNIASAWQEIPLARNSQPIQRYTRLALPMASADGQWFAGFDPKTEELWLSRWGSQQVTKSFPAREVAAVHYCEANKSWWWNDRYSLFRWESESPDGPQQMIDMSSLPNRIVSSPDGRFIAVADSYGACYVWDDGGKRLTNLKFPHNHPVIDLSFSASSQTLMTLTEYGVLRCWNLESGRCTYAEKNQEPQQKRFGGFLEGGRWLMRIPLRVDTDEITIERLSDVGR